MKKDDLNSPTRTNLLKARYSLLDLLLFTIIVGVAAFLWKTSVRRDTEQLKSALFQSPLPAVKLANEVQPRDSNAGFAEGVEYEFTTDWFSWNIPVWEKLFAPVKGAANLRYLEVGVYEGRSALWMLENVLTDSTASVTGIDPFDGPYKDRCISNIEKSGASEKVTLITGYSQLVMRELPLNSYDIIYIDGAHAKDAVMEDAVLSWRLLKDGGLLIFDDYRWAGSMVSSGIDEDTDAPKLALDPFVQCFDQHFDVIHNSYQLILRKRMTKAE